MTEKESVDPRSGAFDRGPTPYFHGRSSILTDFRKTLSNVQTSEKGTVHLVYGAPGSGKSALLHECKKIAMRDQWESIYITVGALWNPDKLLNALGIDKKYKGTESVHQVGIKGFYMWMLKSIRPPLTVQKVLKESSTPLLLILDEVQSLGNKDVLRPNYKEDVVELLELIHNGKMGRPIVLLTAGLGTALVALKALDISRFGEENTTELGMLSDDSARAVIRDWIVKDGRAKDDPSEWIDAIVKETHGWPHHVHSYAKRAGEYLKKNHGVMSPEGLREVMEKGRKGRIKYYNQRVEEIEGANVIHLAQALFDLPAGKRFEKKIVIAELKKEYSTQKAEKAFSDFIEKGVIGKDGQGYSIPISSMHDWLKSELIDHQKKVWKPHAPNSDKEMDRGYHHGSPDEPQKSQSKPSKKRYKSAGKKKNKGKNKGGSKYSMER